MFQPACLPAPQTFTAEGADDEAAGAPASADSSAAAAAAEPAEPAPPEVEWWDRNLLATGSYGADVGPERVAIKESKVGSEEV